MIKSIRCIAVAAVLLAAPVAVAQTTPEAGASTAPAPELKRGVLLVSSDGKRIGRIERILNGPDGTPVSASVIADSRMIYVPASTISANGKSFSTTLTRAEVRKLK